MKFSPSILWSERVLVADRANVASNEANTGFISRLQCLMLNGYNDYFACVPGDQLPPQLIFDINSYWINLFQFSLKSTETRQSRRIIAE